MNACSSFRALLVLVCALWIMMPFSACAEYRLGPGDKVRVKVSEWRQATGQIYEWSALNGEYFVSPQGAISLPLVGTLSAASKTTSELAEAISDRVREAIGLTNRPGTAVDLLVHRPIYVLGDVEKPGEYEFRPGMTVLQALSLAGGLFRPSEFRRLIRETITGEGDLRVLQASRLSHLARRARLQAELNNKDKITFPAELLSRASSKKIAAIMDHESALLTSRRKSYQSKTDSLTRAISLLRHEIEVLEAKRVSVGRQFALAKQELDNINKLVERKLAVSSRQLALEQTVAQFESTKLDLDLGIVRTRQEVSKTERDFSEATNTRIYETLVELSTVDDQLASIAEKSITLHRLIDETQLADSLRERHLAFTVVRKENGEPAEIEINEGEQLRPDDVLKVTRVLTDQTRDSSSSSAIATQRAAEAKVR